MTITINRFDGIFDETPVETVDFETEDQALAWLQERDDLCITVEKS